MRYELAKPELAHALSDLLDLELAVDGASVCVAAPGATRQHEVTL